VADPAAPDRPAGVVPPGPTGGGGRGATARPGRRRPGAQPLRCTRRRRGVPPSRPRVRRSVRPDHRDAPVGPGRARRPRTRHRGEERSELDRLLRGEGDRRPRRRPDLRPGRATHTGLARATDPFRRSGVIMRTEHKSYDIVVVGGGLAGVSAAIAAARAGKQVALIQNRPVLGGNSSSEVRVWVCGATAHGVQHFARETGIMGELFVENQYRNPDGNPYYWDLLLLEKVRAEENLDLFLNTDVTEGEADGPAGERRLRSVTGWMSGSERRPRVVAGTFI